MSLAWLRNRVNQMRFGHSGIVILRCWIKVSHAAKLCVHPGSYNSLLGHLRSLTYCFAYWAVEAKVFLALWNKETFISFVLPKSTICVWCKVPRKLPQHDWRLNVPSLKKPMDTGTGNKVWLFVFLISATDILKCFEQSCE